MAKIPKEQIKEITRQIKGLAEQAYLECTKHDGRGYQGGFLCICEEGYEVYRVMRIGQPELHPEKVQGWCMNCLNKAMRLFQNPSHFSARQSYDFEAKKYFGGIRIRALGIIITFSGLSQELDEALCAWIAVHLAKMLGLSSISLSKMEWWHIRRLSNNPHMNEYGHINAKAA